MHIQASNVTHQVQVGGEDQEVAYRDEMLLVSEHEGHSSPRQTANNLGGIAGASGPLSLSSTSSSECSDWAAEERETIEREMAERYCPPDCGLAIDRPAAAQVLHTL
jgi:hypothetical protein